MNFLLSGSHGLVGSALCAYLAHNGHTVTRLVRSREESALQGTRFWDPCEGELEIENLKNIDAVVHLAGENIGEGRWTEAKKARIRDSRVKGTRILCNALAKLSEKPRVLISASAVGIYGDRGEEVLRKDATPGNDFLARVCTEWEQATHSAQEAGIRTVILRFGVILSSKGGALKKMLFPFSLGVGGVIGNGKQYMSWIALDDVLRIVSFAAKSTFLTGSINAVAPHPVTNYEFTKTLGRILRRPTVLPMPEFVARFAFGEMADALLLASQRVEPTTLAEAGFTFDYPRLEEALSHLLVRKHALQPTEAPLKG